MALLAFFGPSELAGCGGRNTPASAQKDALSWDRLHGVRLRSLQPHAGGLGPDGELWGYQYLTLSEDGTFEWLTEDMVLRGTFRCEGERVLARAEGVNLDGHLDIDRGVLTWHGTEFELP